MSLTPEDIVNHEFKQALRGYAITEVDDLLDRLADQVEHTDRELAELRSRLRDTEARLAEALETDSMLKRAFVTAQQAAEAAVADARAHADELRSAAELEVAERLERAAAEAQRLVDDARETAQTEVTDARAHRAALEARIDELRLVEERHRTTLKRQLEAQLAAIGEPEPPPEVPELTVRIHDEELVHAGSDGRDDHSSSGESDDGRDVPGGY